MAKFFKKSGACGTERVNPSTTAGGNILARPILAINRQQTRARELFKPSYHLGVWVVLAIFSPKKQQFLVALPTP